VDRHLIRAWTPLGRAQEPELIQVAMPESIYDDRSSLAVRSIHGCIGRSAVTQAWRRVRPCHCLHAGFLQLPTPPTDRR
jgi:hypothetical protein